MKTLLTFFRRCHIFHKRFYFKKGFYALILLIFAIGLSLGAVAQMDSGIMTVALATEDDDAVALEIKDTLLSDRGVVRFLDADTKDDAISLVQTGKADMAWIFTAELSLVSDRFAEKQLSRHALVRVVQREEGVLQMLLREKLCGELYPHVSKRYYLQVAREALTAEGIDIPTEETLLSYYTAQMPEGAELFDFHFTEKNTRAGSAVLTAPLRGLLSVTVVLAALAIAMFYKMDAQRGVFIGCSEAQMPFLNFGYHFCAVCSVGFAMLVSLYVAGMFTSVGAELCYLLLFCAAASLFAMILERVCRRLSVLAALTPLLVLGMLVICPVFFTVSGLGFLPYLFPPQYYILASAGAMPVWPMLVYIAVLACLYALLHAVLSQKDLEA